jgi:hypothetical protein
LGSKVAEDADWMKRNIALSVSVGTGLAAEDAEGVASWAWACALITAIAAPGSEGTTRLDDGVA